MSDETTTEPTPEVADVVVPIFTCPACMHTSAPPPGPPPSESIIRCDICQARIAYGEAMPRIVIQPHDDRRFVVVRIGDVDHKWDRKYAHQVGLNIASISGS